MIAHAVAGPHAEFILSMPGLGPVLGAEFIAHTGGDMSIFGSPDRLAGVARLGPRAEGLRTHQQQHADLAATAAA